LLAFARSLFVSARLAFRQSGSATKLAISRCPAPDTMFPTRIAGARFRRIRTRQVDRTCLRCRTGDSASSCGYLPHGLNNLHEHLPSATAPRAELSPAGEWVPHGSSAVTSARARPNQCALDDLEHRSSFSLAEVSLRAGCLRIADSRAHFGERVSVARLLGRSTRPLL